MMAPRELTRRFVRSISAMGGEDNFAADCVAEREGFEVVRDLLAPHSH